MPSLYGFTDKKVKQTQNWKKLSRTTNTVSNIAYSCMHFLLMNVLTKFSLLS